MAETLVSDLAVVPETFLPYSVEQTAEKSELIQSGVIEMNADFASRANIGFNDAMRAGQFTSMPFWQDLIGADEVISDTGALTTAKITSSQDLAVIHNRAKAWSDNDMTGIIGGSDPAQAIGQLSGRYWERRLQQTTLSLLTGIFASGTMTGNSLDIYLAAGSSFTSANYLTASSFIDAKQKMGDVKDTLSAVIMHSAVEANLEKLDLIDYIPKSEQINGVIKVFQGKRVIIDDTMTVAVINSANVYSTYLFGQGAIAYGVGTMDVPVPGAVNSSTWGLEYSRVPLAGQNIMIQRRRFILHPRGVKWVGTMAGLSPSNTEYATGSSWSRVFEAKNVRIVRIRHNVNLA